jgi:hypothetical protein
MPKKKSEVATLDYARVVTICAGHTGHNASYIGLLFASQQDPTVEDLERLMRHQDPFDFFGGFFYGIGMAWEEGGWGRGDYGTPSPYRSWTRSTPALTEPIRRALYLGTCPDLLRTLEGDGRMVYVRTPDELVALTLGELFDNCKQMQKFVDCSACKLQGLQCLAHNAPTTPRTMIAKPQLELPYVEGGFPVRLQRQLNDLSDHFCDDEDWDALKLKNWNSRFANHLVVPSVATSRNAPAPGVKRVRHPFYHDFAGLKATREALSERSKAGVETRRTKREQCTKCAFGGYGYGQTPVSCDAWSPRYCEHGAWSEDQLIDTTLQLYGDWAKQHGVTLRQLWQLFCVAGIEFKHKDPETKRPRAWWLSRPIADLGKPGDPFGVVFKRTSRCCRTHDPEDRKVMSLAEAYKFLTPTLRKIFDDAPPIDRDQLALAAQLSVASHGVGYSFYFSSKDSCGFGYHQPDVSYVQIKPNWIGVELGLWGKTYERTRRCESFESIYNYFGNLPMFDIHRFSGKPNLRAWVR